MFIEENFIEQFCAKFGRYKKIKPGLYNIRCFICGDSRKSKTKKRGYIYQRSGKYFYMCHNCGYSTTFANLLKNSDEKLYKDYIFEKYKSAKITKNYSDEEIEHKIYRNDKVTLDDIATKIINLPHNHIARKYIEKRMIPNIWLYRMYFIDDMNKLKLIFTNYKDTNLQKEPRIIIPMYDEKNKLFGVMARSLDPKNKLRYITLKCEERESIFNLNNVNKDKDIYVVEGAFDSTFLPNSVAVASSNLKSIENILPKDKCILIFDSQPRNREIVKIIENAISLDYRVCLLPPYKDGIKDINEWVISNPNNDIKELIKLINSNIYQGLKAKIKFADWKKI